MPAFIQLPVAPDVQDPGIDYRRGFSEWARKVGDPLRDDVLVFTLDREEVSALQALWSGWDRLDIRLAAPLVDPPHGEATVFVAELDAARVVGLGEFAVQRWSPAGDLSREQIHAESLAGLLAALQSNESAVALCVDLRAADQRQTMTLARQLEWYCAVVADVPEGAVRSMHEVLQAAGMRPSGRPFGVAGVSVAYRRAASLASKVQSFRAEARVRVGVQVERLARLRRAKSRYSSRSVGDSLSTVNSLDSRSGGALSTFPRSSVEAVVERVTASTSASWHVAALDDGYVDAVAVECRERLGVWPISFSYPRALPLTSPTDRLSAIVPGFPYAFTDNDAYLATYARSSMALTFRKAGWDCFRHVEIMASGAVPLMPDASEIPRFAMIHYPKAAMARVAELVMSVGGLPDAETRFSFREYFERHLTTRAMTDYMMRMSGLEGAERVLFVDEQTSVNPEYQSTLALIGLKQLLGQGCEVAFPADFLYTDSTQATDHFYGRGFGYSHVIEPAARTPAEVERRPGHGLDDLATFDAIVLGSISRNSALSARIIEGRHRAPVIVIHGEDGPPTANEAQELRDLDAHVFVRAIHTDH